MQHKLYNVNLQNSLQIRHKITKVICHVVRNYFSYLNIWGDNLI